MFARCLSLCFPRPSRFEPILGGYRVIDANGLALAHLYGQPPNGIVLSDPWFIDSSKKRTSQVCAAYEAPFGELKVCLFKVTNISPSRATTHSPEPLTQVGLINSYRPKAFHSKFRELSTASAISPVGSWLLNNSSLEPCLWAQGPMQTHRRNSQVPATSHSGREFGAQLPRKRLGPITLASTNNVGDDLEHDVVEFWFHA